MKSVVVDTSVLIAVIANEPEKKRLAELVSGCSLIAPRSVFWEIGNAFSAMLKRERVSLQQVEAALDVFRSIPVRYVDIDLAEAVRLAGRQGIYAYDAYLLVCAMRHKAPLVTLDRQMKRMAADLNVEVLEV